MFHLVGHVSQEPGHCPVRSLFCASVCLSFLTRSLFFVVVVNPLRGWGSRLQSLILAYLLAQGSQASLGLWEKEYQFLPHVFI